MSEEPEERSANEIADIARASAAATADKAAGEYDPDDKLSSDTADQKAAYDESYKKS